MTSSDGFCSAVTFAAGELGEKYLGPLATHSRPQHTPAAINTTAIPSNQSTPTATPTSGSMAGAASAAATATTTATTTATAQPMQRQPSAGFPASPSSFVPARPGSPTRSNSVSSIASFAPSAGDPNSLNAPTPAMSSVPSLAAANSGPVPMWTPPLTPAHGQGGSHSASSSVTGVPTMGNTGRRESERSESDREVSTSPKKRGLRPVPEAAEEGRENKRRRIAPIPISESDTAIASTESNTPTPAPQ
jgi:chromatin assembly factor 1 subunit B